VFEGFAVQPPSGGRLKIIKNHELKQLKGVRRAEIESDLSTLDLDST